MSPENEQYKFQKLDVYKIALNPVDAMYKTSAMLPTVERYNFRDQMVRAGTSIVLNIAEGSTGQSDNEQHRFLGFALRSYLETVACLDLAQRRGYLSDGQLSSVRSQGHELFVKLQAFRKALKR
jgi:four helix bundle protein